MNNAREKDKPTICMEKMKKICIFRAKQKKNDGKKSIARKLKCVYALIINT